MCLKSTFLFFWTASVSLHQFLRFSLCHLPCYKSYPNIRSALVMVAYCSSYNSRCTNELSRMFHSLQRCSSLSWSLCSQPRKHWPLECVQTLLCLQSDAKQPYFFSSFELLSFFQSFSQFYLHQASQFPKQIIHLIRHAYVYFTFHSHTSVSHSMFIPTVRQPYVGWTFICSRIQLTSLSAECQDSFLTKHSL